MKKLLILALLGLTAAGCGPKAVKIQPPIGPPEHEVLFAQGLAAFREATPEGYQRAADAFRKAASLSPEHCEYSLHLSESLLFLATEEKLNWEDFTPLGKEAGELVDSVQAQPCAAGFASILNRVKALQNSPELAANPVVAGAVVQVLVRSRGQEAMDAINRAIDADPKDPMNWLVLFKLSSVDPRGPLLRANELAPDLPIVQYEMGNTNLILSHFPEARRYFEHAIELSPRHFHSMIGLAYAISSVDPGATEVLPLYQKASDVAPKYLEAHALLGYYYDGIEETEKAIEQYETTVRLNPKYIPGELSLGMTLFKGERYDEAEKAFQGVLALNASNADAHYYLANIWLERADLPKAETEDSLGIRYRPTFVEAVCLLGVIMERQGRVDQALVQYEQALRIKKDFPDALLARGNIRAQRRQFVDAVADFNAAIQVYQGQAAALEKEAQKSEAAGFLRKAQAERKRELGAEEKMKLAQESRQRVQAAISPEAATLQESESLFPSSAEEGWLRP